ncbi:hypothetical protein [Helicobacter cetorum]|uniref:hypothetical protein n=1 Tax=Helicobacter cetorum TaxID=138563 RepID=UPI0002EB8123|nr:hypothetical protein [Helicobacter cetorum]
MEVFLAFLLVGFLIFRLPIFLAIPIGLYVVSNLQSFFLEEYFQEKVQEANERAKRMLNQ